MEVGDEVASRIQRCRSEFTEPMLSIGDKGVITHTDAKKNLAVVFFFVGRSMWVTPKDVQLVKKKAYQLKPPMASHVTPEMTAEKYSRNFFDRSHQTGSGLRTDQVEAETGFSRGETEPVLQ